jgi:hypothetical protein
MTMTTPTMFDAEQSWGPPVNYARRRWPTSPTGLAEEQLVYSAAALEILSDPWWSAKIQRGLQDSATGRVRSLRDHLATAE